MTLNNEGFEMTSLLQRLRQKFLAFAIRGKLVKQDGIGRCGRVRAEFMRLSPEASQILNFWMIALMPLSAQLFCDIILIQ